MQARSLGFPLAISGEVLSYAGLLPVTDDGLAVQAEAAEEGPILAVAVGGLVQVHEVHVNRGPGDVPIELG